MSVQITEEIVKIHEELSLAALEGRITHERRVAKLKALGVTGAQNIDLDNAFIEKFLEDGDGVRINGRRSFRESIDDI